MRYQRAMTNHLLLLVANTYITSLLGHLMHRLHLITRHLADKVFKAATLTLLILGLKIA